MTRTWSAASPHTARTATSCSSSSTESALRAYGSQGQQRAALLALLFAERELLASRRGRAPLMLLDDVMSELDSQRRELLAGLLRSGGQAVVTATEAEHVPGATEAELIRVSDGIATAPVAAAGRETPAPRPIGAALEKALSGARPPGLLADVQAVWPGVAGDALAASASPVSERDGLVTVACESAVWAQELELLGADLIARLNARLTQGAVGRACALSWVRVRTVAEECRKIAPICGYFVTHQNCPGERVAW